MRFSLAAGLAVAAAALAALLAAGPTAADNGQLIGTVGPGFQITLKDGSGVPVTHLDVGTYTLLVHDLSAEHDFHLSGPGVDVTTQVEDMGDQTFTITVRDGTYTYVCDPHSSRMHGSFTVGSVTSHPPPPATKPLALAVSTGLRAPARLSKGRYAVTVTDTSATNNLHLKGAGVDHKTGVVFKGKAHWAVTLKAGTYRVFSDAHPALRRTITVT